MQTATQQVYKLRVRMYMSAKMHHELSKNVDGPGMRTQSTKCELEHDCLERFYYIYTDRSDCHNRRPAASFRGYRIRSLLTSALSSPVEDQIAAQFNASILDVLHGLGSAPCSHNTSIQCIIDWWSCAPAIVYVRAVIRDTNDSPVNEGVIASKQVNVSAIIGTPPSRSKRGILMHGLGSVTML